MRTFRVSRVTNAKPNRARAQSPDFAIPATFSLEEHLKSRDAWALGDDRLIEATVDFRGASGAARAASQLGTPIEGAPGRRRFDIRRLDTFARWLLSLAGDAVPLAPQELVHRFHALAHEALAVYEPGR
jgi:predicted DNA-binding transcriptional regulator YafY